MPQPPDVSIASHYLFENPWPLGLALVLIGAIMGWSALREGLTKRLRLAGIAGGLGLLVLAAGFTVVTSAEHAKAITRALVDAAVREDVVGGADLFAEDAVFTVGSPKNPGFGVDFIRERLSDLASRYTIETNSITMLRGYSESSDAATVHLACWTTATQGYGATPSQWVLRVQRQPDGSWKITRLKCISINNQSPSPGLW